LRVDRKRHSLAWHLVLGLCLLLMQQAGLRHALEHVAQHGTQHGTQQEDAAPTHAACLLCAAHHAQGHTLAATPQVPAPLALGHVLHAHATLTQCGQGVNLSYLSRAPPSLVSA